MMNYLIIALLLFFTSISKTNATALSKLKLVCGTIEKIAITPKVKKPSYTMYTNFGKFGKKVSVGQFVSNYDMETLINRKVWGVLNFPARRIGGIKSEYLTVGFYDSTENAVLLNNRGIVDIEDGTQIVGTSQNEDLISFEDFKKIQIKSAIIKSINTNQVDIDIGINKFFTISLPAPLDTNLSIKELESKPLVVWHNMESRDIEMIYFRSRRGIVPLSYDKDKDILLGSDLG